MYLDGFKKVVIIKNKKKLCPSTIKRKFWKSVHTDDDLHHTTYYFYIKIIWPFWHDLSNTGWARENGILDIATFILSNTITYTNFTTGLA